MPYVICLNGAATGTRFFYKGNHSLSGNINDAVIYRQKELAKCALLALITEDKPVWIHAYIDYVIDLGENKEMKNSMKYVITKAGTYLNNCGVMERGYANITTDKHGFPKIAWCRYKKDATHFECMADAEKEAYKWGLKSFGVVRSPYGNNSKNSELAYSENDVNATMDIYNSMEKFKRDLKSNIKEVIFNNPATIVFWHDGSKTVVKAAEGEPYDAEKGLAMAITKKALGNSYNYYDIFNEFLPQEDFGFMAYCHLNDHVYKQHSDKQLTHCALKGCDGKKVPIVMSSDNKELVIGWAILHWSDKGILAECMITFNQKMIHTLLKNGTYTLDTWITNLVRNTKGNFTKGNIREVMIVPHDKLRDHDPIKL